MTMGIIKAETTTAFDLVFRFPLFEFADKDGIINVCIAGIDAYSEEYFKAAVWSTQREGFRLKLDIFASAEDCERMDAQYPEIFHTEALDDKDEIFVECKLRELGSAKGGKYDFVLLSDTLFYADFGDILRAAKNSVVLTEFSSNSDGNVMYYPKQERYSSRLLTYYNLEELGLALFCSFEGNTREQFFGDEFYYRSSVASMLFWELRKLHDENITVCEDTMRLEHRRWNAFTRTEGYSFGEMRSKSDKKHPYLVPWDKLPPEVRELDAHPIKVISQTY